jgi:hypothetical protein
MLRPSDTPLNTTPPAPWEAPLIAALERIKAQMRDHDEGRLRVAKSA